MESQELTAGLNGELGSDPPYRFVAGRPGPGGATAVLKQGDRAVTVLSSTVHGYLCFFRWKRREQAHGATAEIRSVVGAARSWIDGADLRGLSTGHPFVEYSDFQLAYERGDAVDFQWQVVLQQIEEDYGHYRDLVILASAEPVLRKCLPRLGHRFALFENEDSESPLFSIFMIRPGWYASYAPDGESFAFEGTAREVVATMTQDL